jgi:hypothetical protein
MQKKLTGLLTEGMCKLIQELVICFIKTVAFKDGTPILLSL